MTRLARRYAKEFKQEAVQLALKSPSVGDTAKELGIPPAILHTKIVPFQAIGKVIYFQALLIHILLLRSSVQPDLQFW